MARLYLFVEGRTEQTYADVVLKPHLANSGVYLHGPQLIAHAKRKGVVHRGGGRKYVPMRDDICRFLKHDRAEDAFFTTMIDLHKIAPGFPGLNDAERLRHVPYDRVRSLERSFAADVGDRRFIPYIQLHEFEAILFCQPSAFAGLYGECRREIADLSAVADAVVSPELIDDGEATAPSRRIINVFPDYADAKVAAASQVAAEIPLEVVRGKCPHFNEWLTALECLARGGNP